MFESSSAGLYWFLLGMLLVLSELALPGFVVIFFGVGAWITALCAWTGIAGGFNSQLLIFLLSSVLSLFLFRKQSRGYFKGIVSGKIKDASQLDNVRGERVMVIEDIIPGRLSGKVEFHGTVWNAEADQEIKKGTTAEIVERNNLTMKVKPTT